MADHDVPAVLRELVDEMNAIGGVRTIGSDISGNDYYIDFMCDQSETGWFGLGCIAVWASDAYEPTSLHVSVAVDADGEEFPIIFTLSGDSDVASPDRVAMWLRGQEEKRTCLFCGNTSVTVGLEEHDACIALLPGVLGACCGHMQEDEVPFIVEGHLDEDELPVVAATTHGQEALDRMRALGGDPPRELTLGQRRMVNAARRQGVV